MTHGYSCRSASDLSIRGNKSSKKVFVIARGLAVLHRNPDNLIASTIRTVPRTVFGCDNVSLHL